MGSERPPPSRFDGPLFASALSRAREALARSPEPSAQGFRLFWVSGRDVGWADLPAGGAYAIVGCHEQCDVVLRGDPRVALRHLLATTIQLADGLALRILDLQTGVPFQLSDGAPRQSIVACGPVIAKLGRFVLGGVPIAPGRIELPDAPPAVAVEDSVVLPVSVRPPPTIVPPQPHIAAPISYVTSLPPASLISSLVSMHHEADERDEPPPREGSGIHEAAFARVTLSNAGRSATVRLDRGDSETGVMIGRLPTCHDRRLLDVLNGGISRGHVLLFRHHDACEAFDLCSTQGTWLREQKVRRVRLSRESTRLRLASLEPVLLEWSGG